MDLVFVVGSSSRVVFDQTRLSVAYLVAQEGKGPSSRGAIGFDGATCEVAGSVYDAVKGSGVYAVEFDVAMSRKRARESLTKARLIVPVDLASMLAVQAEDAPGVSLVVGADRYESYDRRERGQRETQYVPSACSVVALEPVHGDGQAGLSLVLYKTDFGVFEEVLAAPGFYQMRYTRRRDGQSGASVRVLQGLTLVAECAAIDAALEKAAA